MAEIDVGEVWGVGRRLKIHLEQMNIHTVCDLKYASTSLIRKRFGVVLERTVHELNGISCLDLEDTQADHLVRKHQIISSKSFGKPVHQLHELQEAVVSYASRAAEKLRQQQSFCSHLLVYLRTNPFAEQTPQYTNSITIPLLVGSDDTREFARLAALGIEKIYRSGFAYKKAGVMLLGLYPANQDQGDLFCKSPMRERSSHLMQVMDRLNRDVLTLLRSPEIRQKLTSMGALVMGSTPQEFAQFVAAEIKRYEVIVRDSGAPKE